MEDMIPTPESTVAPEEKAPVSVANSLPLVMVSLYGQPSDFSPLVRIGVQKYLQAPRTWQVPGTKTERDLTLPLMMDIDVGALPRWPVDRLRQAGVGGIVGCVSSTEILEIFAALQVPVVNVASSMVGVPFPSVLMDEAAAGRLGAEHLLKLGVRQFGYLGYPGIRWSTLRSEAFRQTIETAGHACSVETWIWDKGLSGSQYTQRNRQHISQWLQGFTGPAGIMVTGYSDLCWIYESCQSLGLKIPGDIAVMFTSASEVEKHLGPMDFSHVLVDPQGVGFQAMQLLIKLISGEPAPAGPILVPPLRVVECESTNPIAARSPAVWRALQYIEQHGTEAITVQDLSGVTGVCRRTLEYHFRQELGRSPAEQIRQTRLAHARKLLTETDLSIGKVSERLGFPALKYFSQFFNELTGMPPTAYRAKNRKSQD